ncbi:formylglycine-generating enzyme family protein [Merismopedia glauca]|uniref:formylglycine-generating enzyme family protein n=1 Tax=Merismopedia glauca TaxID=292586 RepID=UPI0030DD0FC7
MRVSWYDAVEFCSRLCKLTNQEYRLPSEAEWEYACRAGTTTPFHFGETITTDLANYDGNYTYGDAPKGKYRKTTTDVGSFPPNLFGLYDMHGLVWEWCADTWHENYKGATTDGSAWVVGDNNNCLPQINVVGGVVGNDNRSPVRGGSWDYHPRCCCSAYRSDDIAPPRGDFGFDIGFRVVYALRRTL